MTIGTISPREAQTLLAQGAKLIDIRDADEYAREQVPLVGVAHRVGRGRHLALEHRERESAHEQDHGKHAGDDPLDDSASLHYVLQRGILLG